MRERTGYVVIDPTVKGYGPMQFMVGSYEEDSLALWHGDEGTVFWSYEAARNAIRRSVRYAKRYNLPWHAEDFKIKRVRLLEVSK